MLLSYDLINMPQEDALYQSHILIIEDDPEVVQFLSRLISQSYQTTTVQTAKAAFTHLQDNPYALVLLDLSLPDANGFELLRTVRDYLSQDELPIIIISAEHHATAIVKGFELGANDYITKPLEASILMARIRIQLQLQQLRAERYQTILHLEDTDQMRTQLTRIASHDLKTPLNTLTIAQQLLRIETADNPRAQQLLNTMQASSEMMQEVIATFLDVLAIQTQHISINTQRIAVRDVINAVLTQYELMADYKRITLNVRQATGAIWADYRRMVQILANLVSNAIKYSPKGAQIIIETQVKRDHVCIRVIDQGAGVRPEERHLLFTEFGKLSNRPTDGETSTGHGLWIVKHLIDLQGGEVGADFPPQGGSIFWVALPRAD